MQDLVFTLTGSEQSLLSPVTCLICNAAAGLTLACDSFAG